jgi:hypothetical protein
VTQAFLWVTAAPSRSQTPAVTTEAEQSPQFVKNVMAELSAPLALVKHTAGHLSNTPPIQVLGPNAHRVAMVFINPARAAVAVAAAPQESEIGGAEIVLPPLSRQTAFLDERAQKPGRLSLTAMPTPTSLCGRSCDEKARAPPLPRAVLEHCGARAGLWTRKRKCPGQAEQRYHRGGGEHQVRAERDWRSRPAERQHGSGRPDQLRPSGRVITRPGRRRSAGAIYGPRSSDHHPIESTSAQPDLCPIPRRDDRKWRSSVAHRASAPTISTFAVAASLGSTNSMPFRFWMVAFDNASTVVLGLINCSASTQVFPLDETGIQRSDPGDGIWDAQRQHRGPIRDRTAVPRPGTDADRNAATRGQHVLPGILDSA